MQHGPPKCTLLPDTGLATGLSDSSKTQRAVLKVPGTVDLSTALTVLLITARGKKKLQKKTASVSSFLLAEGSSASWKQEHSLLVMVPLASKGGDHST